MLVNVVTVLFGIAMILGGSITKAKASYYNNPFISHGIKNRLGNFVAFIGAVFVMLPVSTFFYDLLIGEAPGLIPVVSIGIPTLLAMVLWMASCEITNKHLTNGSTNKHI